VFRDELSSSETAQKETTPTTPPSSGIEDHHDLNVLRRDKSALEMHEGMDESQALLHQREHLNVFRDDVSSVEGNDGDQEEPKMGHVNVFRDDVSSVKGDDEDQEEPKMGQQNHLNVFRDDINIPSSQQDDATSPLLSTKEHLNVFRDELSSSETAQKETTPTTPSSSNPKGNIIGDTSYQDTDRKSENTEGFLFNVFEDAEVNQCLIYHESAQSLLSDNCISAFSIARNQIEELNLKEGESNEQSIFEKSTANATDNFAPEENNHRQLKNGQWILHKVLHVVMEVLLVLIIAIVKFWQARKCKFDLPTHLSQDSNLGDIFCSPCREKMDTIRLHTALPSSPMAGLSELESYEYNDDKSTTSTSTITTIMSKNQSSKYLKLVLTILNVVALLQYKVLTSTCYLDVLIVTTAVSVWFSHAMG